MHEEHEMIHLSDLTEIFGLESMILKSVGVTIGSSTTHLMFSRLLVRRTDSRTSRFEVSERETIHRSPIVFTPYLEGNRVDTERLHDFIAQVYQDLDIAPDTVDTGAVIITGYAARKENAKAIVDMFSRRAGKFVCATAGPNLEAMLSAFGSGAVLRSKESGETVMNVDIGGGTSKVVIIEAGKIVETSSIFVGSRVIANDGSGRVVRIEESGRLAAQKLGLDLGMGVCLSQAEQEAVAELLAGSLFELMGGGELSPFAQSIMETPPLKYNGKIDALMFSGGVAEYIYGHEKKDFGDLGPFLGEKIKGRASNSRFAMRLHDPEERIRATVMGASQYSMQISGNTIFISGKGVLPRRNLQVVKVYIEKAKPAARDIADLVRSALARYDMDGVDNASSVAIAVNLAAEVAIGPALLRGLAEGLLAAFDDRLAAGVPLVLIFDADIANLVGSALAEKSGRGRDIICIDGIDVGDLDYVDIGTEIQSSETVPVVVKNLVFSHRNSRT